jgi:RNA polymerase sigma factor (sigma-70 family)
VGQQTSNRQIVEELKAGDRSGCSHLMQMYQHRLFEHLVVTFAIPREDAEELVSDTLLNVVQHISLFSFRKSDDDFARWVYTILRNRVRDFLRQQGQQSLTREIFSEDVKEDNETGRTAREIADVVIRDFTEGEENDGDEKNRPLQLVVETLQSMETWERVLLRCRALDIPYEEIAPYVDKPAKQLRIYHMRVKNKFLKKLQEEFEKHSIPFIHENL